MISQERQLEIINEYRLQCAFLAQREGEFFLWGDFLYRLNFYDPDFVDISIERVGRMSQTASVERFSTLISAMTLRDSLELGHASWLPTIHNRVEVCSGVSKLDHNRLRRVLNISAISPDEARIMTVFFVWEDEPYRPFSRRATLSRFLLELQSGWIRNDGGGEVKVTK